MIARPGTIYRRRKEEKSTTNTSRKNIIIIIIQRVPPYSLMRVVRISTIACGTRVRRYDIKFILEKYVCPVKNAYDKKEEKIKIDRQFSGNFIMSRVRSGLNGIFRSVALNDIRFFCIRPVYDMRKTKL